MALVIFDIDDTLFDWLSMWSTSFTALVDTLVPAANVDRESAKRLLRAFHVGVGTSEYPYTATDLREVFSALSLDDAERIADGVRTQREAGHVLFPGIENVLERLRTAGTQVVMHTDAPPALAARRLRALGLSRWATALYSTASARLPDPTNSHSVLNHRKPEPQALRAILELHNATADEAMFIGDSLYKDIAMAHACGVRSVHALYGCRRDGDAYELLRAVSHWTDADIAREKEISRREVTGATFVAQSPDDLVSILEL